MLSESLQAKPTTIMLSTAVRKGMTVAIKKH